MRRRNDLQAGITLVELLVVMVIMTIVSTMLIGVWFALTNASAFSSNSSVQQDNAREAVARMSREIRDAQAPADVNVSEFVMAQPNEIRLYTTFNDANADDPLTIPRLVRFFYEETDAATHSGAIYREISTGGAWGSRLLLVKNVVNQAQSPTRPVFTYTAFGDSGVYQSDSLADPSQIVDVTITALVDLNPGHSPAYVTLQTTVQPRNTLQL